MRCSYAMQKVNADSESAMHRFHTRRILLYVLVLVFLVCGVAVNAELWVTVSPPKIVGQKVVVSLTMSNGLSETLESARAAVFLFDGQGKAVGRSARWVVGGQGEPGFNSSLRPGGTNAFHFVVASERPLASSNLTAKVSFVRALLSGGKAVDVAKEIIIKESLK